MTKGMKTSTAKTEKHPRYACREKHLASYAKVHVSRKPKSSEVKTASQKEMAHSQISRYEMAHSQISTTTHKGTSSRKRSGTAQSSKHKYRAEHKAS